MTAVKRRNTKNTSQTSDAIEQEDISENNENAQGANVVKPKSLQMKIREFLWIPVVHLYNRVFGNPFFYLRLIFIAFVSFSLLSAVGAVLQFLKGENPDSLSKRLNVDEIMDEDALNGEVNWKLASEAMGLAMQATMLALKLWFRLILSIVLPTSQRSWIITKEGWTAMQPSIRQATIWFLNTDITTKVIIIALVLLSILIILLEHQVRKNKYLERFYSKYANTVDRAGNKYTRVKTKVERTSRFAAQLLPHVIFGVWYGLIVVVLPVFLHNFASGFYGWAVVVGFPVVAAGQALIAHEAKERDKDDFLGQRKERAPSGLPPEHPMSLTNAQGPFGYIRSIWSNLQNRVATTELLGDASKSKFTNPDAVIREYRDLKVVLKWLRYWTVIGVALLLEQLPVTGHAIQMLPFWPELRLGYSLWLQIPGTHGSDLAFTLVVPLINKYFKKVNGANGHEKSKSMLINMLFGLGIIDVKSRARLSEIFDTGGTLIMISLPFFFTPAFITSIGNLICGLGYPIYSSASSLVNVQVVVVDAVRAKRGQVSKSSSKKKRNRSESISMKIFGQHCVMWLEYWVVYTLLVMVQSYASWTIGWFIPLWTHSLLVGTLWLQLPYFRGAHAIFKLVIDLWFQWQKRTPITDEETLKQRAKSYQRSIDPLDVLDPLDPVFDEDSVSEEKESKGWFSNLFTKNKRNSKSSETSSILDGDVDIDLTLSDSNLLEARNHQSKEKSEKKKGRTDRKHNLEDVPKVQIDNVDDEVSSVQPSEDDEESSLSSSERNPAHHDEDDSSTPSPERKHEDEREVVKTDEISADDAIESADEESDEQSKNNPDENQVSDVQPEEERDSAEDCNMEYSKEDEASDELSVDDPMEIDTDVLSDPEPLGSSVLNDTKEYTFVEKPNRDSIASNMSTTSKTSSKQTRRSKLRFPSFKRPSRSRSRKKKTEESDSEVEREVSL